MFTPASLDTLVQSDEFKHLATALALESGERGWEALVDRLEKKGVEVAIWEAYQRIGVLFDTYKHAIEGVSVGFEEEFCSDGSYLSISVTINGCVVSDGDVMLNDEAMAQTDSIDESRVLNDTVSFVYYMVPNSMLKEIQLLSDAFPQSIESGGQARALASVHAPNVDAHVRKRMLEQVISDGPRVDEGRRACKF